MEGVIWAALITAMGAVVIALGGWYANRRMGLPGKIQQLVRQERKLYEEALEQKAQRLEAELATERAERQQAAAACDQRVTDLIDAIIERDLIIVRLHHRLGLPKPYVTDPRS